MARFSRWQRWSRVFGAAIPDELMDILKGDARGKRRLAPNWGAIVLAHWALLAKKEKKKIL